MKLSKDEVIRKEWARLRAQWVRVPDLAIIQYIADEFNMPVDYVEDIVGRFRGTGRVYGR